MKTKRHKKKPRKFPITQSAEYIAMVALGAKDGAADAAILRAKETK